MQQQHLLTLSRAVVNLTTIMSKYACEPKRLENVERPVLHVCDQRWLAHMQVLREAETLPHLQHGVHGCGRRTHARPGGPGSLILCTH